VILLPPSFLTLHLTPGLSFFFRWNRAGSMGQHFVFLGRSEPFFSSSFLARLSFLFPPFLANDTVWKGRFGQGDSILSRFPSRLFLFPLVGRSLPLSLLPYIFPFLLFPLPPTVLFQIITIWMNPSLIQNILSSFSSVVVFSLLISFSGILP